MIDLSILRRYHWKQYLTARSDGASHSAAFHLQAAQLLDQQLPNTQSIMVGDHDDQSQAAQRLLQPNVRSVPEDAPVLSDSRSNGALAVGLAELVSKYRSDNSKTLSPERDRIAGEVATILFRAGHSA